jgi:hypothetical protein
MDPLAQTDLNTSLIPWNGSRSSGLIFTHGPDESVCTNRSQYFADRPDESIRTGLIFPLPKNCFACFWAGFASLATAEKKAPYEWIHPVIPEMVHCQNSTLHDLQ